MITTKQSIAFNRNKIYTSLEIDSEPDGIRKDKLLSLVQMLNARGYYLPKKACLRLSIEDIEDFFSFKSSIKKTDNAIVLDVIGEEEFKKIPIQIMLADYPLPVETKLELIWFLNNYKDLQLPSEIKSPEALSIVVDARPEIELKKINDVLRYAFLKLGVLERELPKLEKGNSEWRKLLPLPRKTRKDILERISKVYSSEGDQAIIEAKKHYGHWMLLSERVHSGDYAKLYPDARKFFEELQGNSKDKKYRTWESKLQEIYDKGGDTYEIAEMMYSTKPERFIKNFNTLVNRMMAKKEEDENFEPIISLLLDVKVNNKILLEQLYSTVVLDPDLKEMINTCLINKIYENLKENVKEDLSEKLVYIDPLLKNIPVHKELVYHKFTIAAKINIPEETDVIRFYFPGTCTYSLYNSYNGTCLTPLPHNVMYDSKLKSKYSEENIERRLKKGNRFLMLTRANHKKHPAWFTFVGQKNEFNDYEYCRKTESLQNLIFDLEERSVLILNIDRTTSLKNLNHTLIIPKPLTVYDFLKQYYTSMGNIITPDKDNTDHTVNSKDILLNYQDFFEILK